MLLTKVLETVKGAQVVVQVLESGSGCAGALVSELLFAPARVIMGVLVFGVRLIVPTRIRWALRSCESRKFLCL